MLAAAFGLLCAAVSPCSFAAQALTGSKTIVLSNAAGERQVIGKVVFSDGGGGRTAFALQIDEMRLGEYFLAMRPFRCLTGPKQRLCWFPVRNEPALITPEDLLPLEYALMFMRTKPADLHVDAFNGVYYKLKWTDAGITGSVNDLDMAPFIAPDTVPLARRARPVTAKDLQPGDESSHWLPRLSIE